jgi:mRNA-degrading endonuclease toxin of MazEF toxin-antitoxin module
MTNQAKGYPYEVSVPNAVKMGGGVVLADHVKSFDRSARNAQFECAVPAQVVSDVKAKLRTLIP